MPRGAQRLVDVDGRHLTLSNLDKVMYPETGMTKGEVISYYAEIAPFMLPHVAGRAVTQIRWVHGVGTPEHPLAPFFEKQIEASAPEWVRRGVIQHSDGPKTYPIAADRATLVWLAQQAALEIHVPQWRFDATGEPGNPDRIVLDLDPGDGVGLRECAQVARLARPILDGMGLHPVPVTSGSKGIHLYAALDGSWTSQQVSEVAHELARALEADHPDLVVSNMRKAVRTGRVLVDWSQNNGKKTTIAPYSLRGRPRPTVAAPRSWAEIASPKLRHLAPDEVLDRVRKRGDPMAAVDGGWGVGFDLAPADASAGEHGPLAPYRAKRDAGATPEPVPESAAAGPSSGGAPRFVVQEHHARRLHYDFRLERDGVLRSWAVPKGLPTDPGRNHLAVEVEDHPLEYGAFEGTIPKGEYGAGTVSIWDDGTYEIEKWRPAEVIVTLHGRVGGPIGTARYALIRTSGSGEKAQWLLHRTKQQPGASSAGRSSPPGNGRPAPQAGRPARGARSSAPSDPPDGPSVPPDGPPAPQIPYRPMLAVLGSLTDLARGHRAIEYKWDGIRALVRSDGRRVRLMTRNGIDVTEQYPELAGFARVTSGPAIVDGEIVALDPEGRPDFGLLQRRMNLGRPAEIARLAASAPVTLLLFDVLEVDSVDVTGLPYVERRGRLEALVRQRRGVPVEVPRLASGTPEQAFAEASRRGLEGIVAKDPASPYRSGARSREWIKVKRTATQEVVIGGWRPGTGRRASRIGSLLVGIPGEDGLVYAGRVGTGFGETELDRLLELLRPLGQTTSPLTGVPSADASDAVWVRPELVGEIEFRGWTRGGAARQASWRGLRPDKAPEDVVREG